MADASDTSAAAKDSPAAGDEKESKCCRLVGTPGASAPYETEDGRKLYPHGPCWGPIPVRDVKVGETKLWCTCGLSKKQPFCDGSHVGTGFKPLKWTVPGTLKDGARQSVYTLCGCKYTKAPPYCDATHIHVPCEVLERMETCDKRVEHGEGACKKMCTDCGWAPDW